MHVVVTGASRGIGAGLVDFYRAEGVEVTALSRFAGKGILSAGIANPAAMVDAANTAGPVDLLVCNAGIYLDRDHTLGNGFNGNIWGPTFAVNVTSVFLTIDAFLPNIRSANGKIAIISSIMASDEKASGGSYVYRASKAAALNLGRNLAHDLRPEGIAVGIYHPGWVRTEMGGPDADISVEESVAGLVNEFEALTVETTGCFRAYDGTKIPF